MSERRVVGAHSRRGRSVHRVRAMTRRTRHGGSWSRTNCRWSSAATWTVDWRARGQEGTCRDDDTGARRVTRVASAKWCTSGVHRARTLSPAGDRVSLPYLRPCPRPRARVSALGEIARPSTRMDWRVVRGSVDYPGAVPPPDWSTWWYFSGRRGVPGGASQSRVSFLLSVFHCVFKFVIYDPD